MYTFKTIGPINRQLPCHAANPDMPYASDDADWEYEMLQQVAFFMRPAKGKAAVPMSRADIDAQWQIRSIDFINDMCAKADKGQAPTRTKHLFLEIQLKMTSLLNRLVSMGVLECGEWDTYPKQRRSARLNKI